MFIVLILHVNLQPDPFVGDEHRPAKGSAHQRDKKKPTSCGL